MPRIKPLQTLAEATLLAKTVLDGKANSNVEAANLLSRYVLDFGEKDPEVFVRLALKRTLEDAWWMDLALVHARHGRTTVQPRVGALLVHNEELVAASHSDDLYSDDAVLRVIQPSREGSKFPRGATLYVTLEPRLSPSPPCGIFAILSTKIARVVIGSMSADPRVESGAEHLQSQGVDVTVGVRKDECDRLIARWAYDIAQPTTQERLWAAQESIDLAHPVTRILALRAWARGRHCCNDHTCELDRGHDGRHGQFDSPPTNGYDSHGRRTERHWLGA